MNASLLFLTLALAPQLFVEDDLETPLPDIVNRVEYRIMERYPEESDAHELATLKLKLILESSTSDAEKINDLKREFPAEHPAEAEKLLDGDPANPAEWIVEAYEGDSEQQYKLGIALLEAAQEEKGLEWLQRAADAQNADALCELGLCYAAKCNVVRAIPYLKAAADLGNTAAAQTLGFAYQEQENFKEAMRYFKIASTNKDEIAECAIGEIYWQGRPGIPVNLKKAEIWFKKATSRETAETPAEDYLERVQALIKKENQLEKSDLSVPENLKKLAAFYIKEKSDFQAAEKIYLELAAQSDSFAHYELGQLYWDGRPGVAKSLEKALEHFKQADALGNPNAKYNVRNLEKLIFYHKK